MSDAEFYLQSGNVHLQKGEFDRALADYTKAIELKPELVVAYYNRGNAYYAKGEFDRALADYTKAIELKPKYAAAYYNRGSALVRKGELSKALSDFEEGAKRASPDDIIRLWAVYAQYLWSRSKAQNEIWDVYRASQFNEISKLKPQDSPGYIRQLTFLISELNDLISRNEQILKGFKKDASKKKERVRKVLKMAYYLKGIFSYQQNNHIAAVRSLEQALRHDKKFDEGEQLLRYIWESHCRPAWWRWWFFAPKPLKRWRKRAVASVLVLFLLLIVSLPFYFHLFAPAKLSERGVAIVWVFYLIPVVLCLFILLSPSLLRFRTGDFEVELTPAIETMPEPELTPSIIKALTQ